MSQDCPLIAVIDDEESVRTALRRLLQSAGMQVETFSGGGEYLESLGTHQPDCAVLDVHMPDLSGFEVLTQLAEMGASVPIIVMTGQDTPDAETSAKRGGASAYLRKPIKDHVLLAAISAAVATKPPQL